MGDVAGISGGTFFFTSQHTPPNIFSATLNRPTGPFDTIGSVKTPAHTPRMRRSTRHRSDTPVPLEPLLECFRSFAPPPIPTLVIIHAANRWLNAAFLDAAPDAELIREVARFHETVHPVPIHRPWLDRRGRFLRHALNHLVRGQEALPERLMHCVEPTEPYFVPGLGPGFWSAITKALHPENSPMCCPAVERGLRRLGYPANVNGNIADRFRSLCQGYERIRTRSPEMTASAIDDFLERVGRMGGRELPSDQAPVAAWSWQPEPERVRQAVREVRVRYPLRRRLREIPTPAVECSCDLVQLDDALHPGIAPEDRPQLMAEVVSALREQFRVHPLEVPDVVAAVARSVCEVTKSQGFMGFCTDTFRFLGELADAYSKDWMTPRRDRYKFVLREPLIELCDALAERYVEPVLNREYGWDLECEAKPGRAITSICKNDFGRSAPYQPVQWITYYRRSQATKRADAQFFVRVAADGVTFGFHLTPSARLAGKHFRQNVQEHGGAIYAALAAGGVFDHCRFWTDDEGASEVSIRSAADLRTWAANKLLLVGRHFPVDSPLLRSDELVGEILLTFDRLVPAFACAAEADPLPLLHRRAGLTNGGPPFDRAAFTRETYLSELWLERVLGLLRMKRQLVFQGVPGTGKTHVTKCLARLLTHDRPECVRLVQFHPAYSYEEFVEGIRVRNVEVNGRNEVNYPVEAGVLCEFAERAAAHPSEPYVLVIDELNRGNLPRIFGELLYLLEYRDQEVTLPYSKRLFRLPENLFVLATMNAADRSAVVLDQALRRRFSFVEMEPDAAILARWLETNSPEHVDDAFGTRVVLVFEELNRKLAREVGPGKQIGHSFFMLPGLDEERFASVWEHHVHPMLLDYLGGRHERLAEYEPERLLGHKRRRAASSA